MSSIINKAFNQEYNKAAEFFKDEVEACIEKAQEILNDSAAPRYHRMKTWILLGKCLGDWEEVNECVVKAEVTWRIVRRWHAVGTEPGVDEALEELRADLEDLKTGLDEDEDKPQGYNRDEAVAARLAEHDGDVAPEKAAEFDDADAVRKAE